MARPTLSPRPILDAQATNHAKDVQHLNFTLTGVLKADVQIVKSRRQAVTNQSE